MVEGRWVLWMVGKASEVKKSKAQIKLSRVFGSGFPSYKGRTLKSTQILELYSVVWINPRQLVKFTAGTWTFCMV